MNQVSLIGRLTQDPTLRDTNSGQNRFVGFTLAVNDFRGNNEFTNFVPCIAWDTVAENMSKFLKKGSLVAVTGRISVRSKNDNGKYETIVNINADRVEFLESKSATTHHNNPMPKTENNVLESFKEEKQVSEPNDSADNLDDSILWD